MKFIATQVSVKPFIVWVSIPDGSYDDPESQYYKSTLVIDEQDIPENISGVCPLKIYNGKLVERTQIEMEAFAAQYTSENFIQEQKDKLNDVNLGTFNYDTETFPMDERSRLFYYAMASKPPVGDVECMTVNGDLYTLLNANITAFLGAYYTALMNYSKPTFEI